MPDREYVEAVVAGVEALLVAILTVPAVSHLVARAGLYKANGYGSISGFYEDEDGEATEKSTLDYSDLAPRTAAWLGATLGLGASIAAGVLSQHGHSHLHSGFLGFLSGWADVVAWVSLAVSGSNCDEQVAEMITGAPLNPMRVPAAQG